ncbi:hypothetical protein H2200_002895 [Cladophialophora chaetospira]|uniref:VOC domain-containing protein n=1 Tax=Cladophialophora chaetospira TaxID=386627 RepID=A0AA38XH73_9EURO|nr:hypothetical protein H2200_002895 [Cladophialophora chaetospira]
MVIRPKQIVNGDKLSDELDQIDSRVISPISLAHVVFRTANMKPMLRFWEMFLGATISYADDTIAFLRYDEEHHRVAIVAMPANTTPRVSDAAGLEHVAFTFRSLDGLLTAYSQRKARGIMPFWCVNHGPTTSIYYRDPDNNKIETQVDNFENVDEAESFMMSSHFAENTVGTDFDPDELHQRVKAGESQKEMKRRIEIGPRLQPDLEADVRR